MCGSTGQTFSITVLEVNIITITQFGGGGGNTVLHGSENIPRQNPLSQWEMSVFA